MPVLISFSYLQAEWCALGQGNVEKWNLCVFFKTNGAVGRIPNTRLKKWAARLKCCCEIGGDDYIYALLSIYRSFNVAQHDILQSLFLFEDIRLEIPEFPVTNWHTGPPSGSVNHNS